MTLKFMCGFDHLATGQLDEDGWVVTSATQNIEAGGRVYGTRLRFGNASNGVTPSITRVLTAEQIWVWQVAFIVDTQQATQIAVLDGATEHFRVVIPVSGGVLSCSRAGTALASGTTVLTTASWHLVSVYVKIGDAGVGEFQIKLDGVDEPNLNTAGGPVAADTRNAGNATADRIRFVGSASLGQDAVFDDFVVWSGTGETLHDDTSVQAIYPNGNGNSSQLVGSDGNSTDNYLLVDEATPNGDTDYVASATPGDKDTYAFGNVTPSAGTVLAVQTQLYARKDDAGTRQVCTVARLSGTEVDGATKTLTTTYLSYLDVRDTKPGGGAWSISDVNSAEFGVKVVA